MTDPHDQTQTRRRFLRTTGVLAGTVALGGIATGTVGADASNSPALPGRVYANDMLFATRDTTDLPPPTGGNEHSFDDIYVVVGDAADGQFPVAEAAPGEQDFNGGRWKVILIEFTGDPTLLTNDDQVHDGIMNGDITVVDEGVRYFECPLVRLKA